jgi:flagellar biogenesis protein FliO
MPMARSERFTSSAADVLSIFIVLGFLSLVVWGVRQLLAAASTN